MPTVRFTKNVQRHVVCPEAAVDGGTVADALDAYFQRIPEARAYVLDDRGALREHMAIFVDSAPLTDREALLDRVGVDSVIDVWQAVSGG